MCNNVPRFCEGPGEERQAPARDPPQPPPHEGAQERGHQLRAREDQGQPPHRQLLQ